MLATTMTTYLLHLTLVEVSMKTEAEFINVQFRLRFLGRILRVLRLEVSVYNVYITNQFQTTFAQKGGGEVG
jgi:hypothetical protein